MNPKDQIHYDIAELLEKIAHLNIKLAGTSKIHPVEIDLLRSYLRELDKLTDAMPVMQLPKPSFAIPAHQDEPTTLPSFNTPEESASVVETMEQVAELEATVAEQSELETEPEVEVESAAIIEEPAEEITTEPETIELETETGQASDETAETKSEATNWQVTIDNTEKSPTPETESPEPEIITETPTAHTEPEAEPEIEIAQVEEAPVAETTEYEAPSTIEIDTEPIEEEITAEAAPIEVEAEHEEKEEELTPSAPEPFVADIEEETRANTGPELPIIETPMSYEPPVSEPEAKRSINDMFSREGKEDLGSKFQFQNRKNLREMIDLSERYVFTKELFGGDADYYDRAIRQLNQFETWAEAETFMTQDLYNKYNWAGKDAVQKQFARIVERRFA